MELTLYQEHIRWKLVTEEVGRIVRALKGETGTRFENLDELHQECLVHVYEKIPQFMGKNDCKEFSFIYQLCRNHLINYQRFHIRGKRDYRKKVNSGLHPVNFIGHYAEEDADEVHYMGRSLDSPEDILRAEQLAQAMTDKQQSDKTFREFIDWAWDSHYSVVDLTSNKAIMAFDRLMEEI